MSRRVSGRIFSSVCPIFLFCGLTQAESKQQQVTTLPTPLLCGYSHMKTSQVPCSQIRIKSPTKWCSSSLKTKWTFLITHANARAVLIILLSSSKTCTCDAPVVVWYLSIKFYSWQCLLASLFPVPISKCEADLGRCWNMSVENSCLEIERSSVSPTGLWIFLYVGISMVRMSAG